MNENVIFNRTFKNMLAVKNENNETKLLPVINITELAKLMQFGQMAFYFSLLNTCRKYDRLRESFSTENISLIASKAGIPEKKVKELNSSIFKNKRNPDTMELMCSISPDKNKMLRMNFPDDDHVGVKSEDDVLWWLCRGTNYLEKFPKNGFSPILIMKENIEDKIWDNILQNVKTFFERIKTANGDKEYTKDNFNFLDIFFKSTEPEYNIPTDKNGYLTICDSEETKDSKNKAIVTYKLNDAGKKLKEILIDKLKIEDPAYIKAIEDELINMVELLSGTGMLFSESEKEDYIDEIKTELWKRFNTRRLDSPILGKDLLPNEAYNYAKLGHIHYFMLYVYTCLLPYVLEIFEKGVEATLKKRKLAIKQVLEIIKDFKAKSLPEKYSSLKSISSAICAHETFKICNSDTFEEFAEKINDMAMIFHNAMFADIVKTATIEDGTHYQITQFDFACLDLHERTYADGFWLNGNLAFPISKLFKHYKIEADLPKSISDGNQQIPDKFEWFKFPCEISALGRSELNELEPEQVIENIKKFSDFQIKEFAIKNIINVFECVSAPGNDYTEDNKRNVFEKFFGIINGLIIRLSAKQILNWQNYISALKLSFNYYDLPKAEIIKLAGYINENKFSADYEIAFFSSLVKLSDKIDIYKVISFEKIMHYQAYINDYEKLLNIDADFKKKFFKYINENLSNENVKRFITKKNISDLFFENCNMPINEIYDIFYANNDYNFNNKFFPKNKVKELIIFMEEVGTKHIISKFEIYASQKYIFNEFLNYIFEKKENEQLLNIVVNKINDEPQLISWLDCKQVLKFVNFCSINSDDSEKKRNNQFLESCKTHLKDNEFFMYVAENIADFPENTLKFFPKTLNYLSCEEIWNLQEELTYNEFLTFDEKFNKFYELTDYVFREGKNINLLRAILRQNPFLIQQIIYWPKLGLLQRGIQISKDKPITSFYINSIKPRDNNTGFLTKISYTTEKRINEILCKTEFFYKLILNDKENFDEDFISVIKQDINVYDLDLIFFAFEHEYGIDNVPENYKLLLQHFIDNFDWENSRVKNFKLKSFLPFAEFYFNFTENNEEKFVHILKALINNNLYVLKYFLSDDENERLDFKKEIFHYTRNFTENESTKLFISYCREKIQKNDITISLSVQKIFELWKIGGEYNEFKKLLISFLLNANLNGEYLHNISEEKKNILKDMLKYDNRLVRKLAATDNYGILSLFTIEQIIMAKGDISKENFQNLNINIINDLIDYILDNNIKINFSFLEKVIYAISGKFDSNSVIDRSKRKKLEKLFEVCDASKYEKLNCFMALYNGYCFLSGSHIIIPSSPNFNKHDAVWFINSIFDSSFKFADISINDFFEEVPEVKESYLDSIKSECNGFKLFLLIVNGLCSLPVVFYSAIAVYGFVIGVTSLGAFLGLLIASVVLLSDFGYFLIRFAKNKIKLRKINYAFSCQKLNLETPPQSRQPGNNIMNQEQNRQNQIQTARPPIGQPAEQPQI